MIDTHATAGRREWTGLAVLVLPCLLVSMDIGVLFYALPFLTADLEPTATEQLWMMDIYSFVLAGLLVTMGALGDRIGRRRLLLVGAAAFSVASIAAAYSANAGMLVATRAALGIAGATLMPSTLALIRNLFHDPAQRKTAIAVWTGALIGGTTLGPVVGGFLLNHFWWGSAFLINVPAMVLLLALGPALLPEFRSPATGRFDLPGAALSLAAVLPVIYGIKRMAVDGADLGSTACIVIGLLLGACFVVRQRTAATPLVDLALFGRREFSASLLVNVVAIFALVGSGLYTTQFLQLVFGMRPLTAALWSLTVTPVLGVTMAISGALSRRVRPAYLLAGGLLLGAVGCLLLTQVRVDSSLFFVLAAAATLSAGVMVAMTLAAELVLSSAPPAKAGAASAVSETGSELGGAFGIAILGSIGAAFYQDRMAAADTAGLPAAAAEASRETLAGAVAVAADVPATAGAALIRAGQAAFTAGMNAAFASAGAVLVVAALVAVLALRRTPSAEPSPEPAAVAA